MEFLGIIIVFCLILMIIVIVSIFNNCIKLRNKVRQAKSTIDVYLTQRFDLIPNLVECVKGYRDYEKATLVAITELRETYNSNKSIENANSLANSMNALMARAEEMAELKANEQFLMLQKNLSKIESQLQAARRIYNGDVTLYNKAIQSFPNNIIANILKFEPAELFTIEEYKAQNIEVKI